MTKHLKIFFLCVGFVLSYSPWVIGAPLSRKQIIQYELRCVSQNRQSLNWSDVCATDDFVKEQRQNQINQALDAFSMTDEQPEVRTPPPPARIVKPPVNVLKPAKYAYVPPTAPPPQVPLEDTSVKRNPGQLEIGTETYSYVYREYTEFVKDTGTFYGGYLNYTYRFFENKPIADISKFYESGIGLNVVRLESRIAAGTVKYDGSFIYKNIPDWTFELRLLLGIDIPFTEDQSSRLTPYFGVGYRYLQDNFDEVPPTVVGNTVYLSGYERESNYFYLPIGFQSRKDYKNGWMAELTGEFDLLIVGQQISHLEDMYDINGEYQGEDKAVDRQNYGYGARGFLNVIKKGDKVDFNFGPFVRYWRIQDSEVNNGGREPKNNTTEFGLKLGIDFN